MIISILKVFFESFASIVVAIAKAVFSISDSIDSIKEIFIAAIFNVPVLVITIGFSIVGVIRLIFKAYNFIANN